MIEKISGYCKNTWNFVYEQGYSVYELILKVLMKQDEIIDDVNALEDTVSDNYNTLNSKIDSNYQNLNSIKEDSDNITNNRLLSETGNFTGTLCGNKTACEVNLEIDNNYQKIQFLTNQFEDGATGLVIECGYFEDTEINRSYDGGAW